MAGETKMTPQRLAHDILSQLTTSTPKALAQAQKALADADATATLPGGVDGLVALYFACEDADERDIVFERLVACAADETEAFFDAMRQDDEDEFLRIAAASVLFGRGHAVAGQQLLAYLQTGGDVALFEQAMAGLMSVPTLALYPVLSAIWQDSEREGAERRAAMLGMERLDADAAAQAMVQFIDGIDDLTHFADDQLEVAMAMLARQPSQAALLSLERLALRVRHVHCADAEAEEDRAELHAFVSEGVTLVRSALAPA